jgi:hypothetical protein
MHHLKNGFASKFGHVSKQLKYLLFSPTPVAGEKSLSTNSDHHPKSPGKYFYTPSSILIAICKIYGQV